MTPTTVTDSFCEWHVVLHELMLGNSIWYSNGVLRDMVIRCTVWFDWCWRFWRWLRCQPPRKWSVCLGFQWFRTDRATSPETSFYFQRIMKSGIFLFLTNGKRFSGPTNKFFPALAAHEKWTTNRKRFQKGPFLPCQRQMNLFFRRSWCLDSGSIWQIWVCLSQIVK